MKTLDPTRFVIINVSQSLITSYMGEKASNFRSEDFDEMFGSVRSKIKPFNLTL